MHLNDPQVVLWTKRDGLTILAAAHMAYSPFDHSGLSGGSHARFTPRSETYICGVRLGWWQAGTDDYALYEPTTLRFAAKLTILNADAIPN